MRAKALLVDFPEVAIDYASDLNDELVTELTAGSDHIVSWRCPVCGGIYKTSPYHRTKEKTGCPYCSNKRVLKGFNDLMTRKSEYIQYWDYKKNVITPDNIMYCSNKLVAWNCENGHSFTRSVRQMVGTNKVCCPVCKKEAREKKKQENENLIKEKIEKEKTRQLLQIEKNKSRIKKENQRKVGHTKALKRLDSIMMLFDSEENQKYGIWRESLRIGDAVWLKCKRGHKWCAMGGGKDTEVVCPICDGLENSIAKKFPGVVSYYDEEKNGVPASEKKAVEGEYLWWRCKNNHSFISPLLCVMRHGTTGCMFCDREKSYYSPCGWSGRHM